MYPAGEYVRCMKNFLLSGAAYVSLVIGVFSVIGAIAANSGWFLLLGAAGIGLAQVFMDKVPDPDEEHQRRKDERERFKRYGS